MNRTDHARARRREACRQRRRGMLQAIHQHLVRLDAAVTPLPLLIFPCNGNGREACDCLGDGWQLLAYVDDQPERHAGWCDGVPVLGRAALQRWPQARVLAVPGGPRSFRHRSSVIEGLGVAPARWARVVHPSAQVSPRARMGHNVLVMAGVVVCSHAVIGDHVCMLPNTVVHHDSEIGDWSLVGANVTVAGNTRVGRHCYVGGGSSLMQGLHIGDGTLVGLGSNVIRPTRAGSCVAGNPARDTSDPSWTPAGSADGREGDGTDADSGVNLGLSVRRDGA